MFCIKCGKELSEDSVFCPKCGQKVADGNEGQKEEHNNTIEKDKKSSLMTLFGANKNIIYAVCLIILLVIIICVVVSNNAKKTVEPAIVDEPENVYMDMSDIPAAEETAIEVNEVYENENSEASFENDYSYNIGDVVFFGTERSNSIEWTVIGRERGKALLLQNKLDDNHGGFGSRQEDYIRWETSKIRDYLNGKFYEESFSDNEKDMILEEKHDTNNNPVYGTTGGNTTYDKVFILSTEEVEKYMPDAEKRITQYENEDPNAYQPKEYILRTMGENGYAVCFVDENGNINYEGQTEPLGHCRYAIWVKVDNDSFENENDNINDSIQNNDVTVEVGGNLELGKWVQDGEEKSVINWNVLAIKDNRALLISSKNLDTQYYNSEDGDDPITWENSYARRWLEDVFYNEAFSAEEKNKICLSDISTPDNEKGGADGGNDTKDHVFLLSTSEAEKYLPTYELMNVENTQHVNNIWVDTVGKGHESTSWATRSPGEYGKNIQITFNSDRFTDVTANSSRVNIRPALWLDLTADGYKSESVDEIQVMAENASQILNEESTNHINSMAYAVYDFNCDGVPDILSWVEGKYHGQAYLYIYDGVSWKVFDREYSTDKVDKVFWNPDHNTFVIEGIDGDNVIIYECDAFSDRATESFSFKAREDKQKENASRDQLGNQLVNIETSNKLTVGDIKRLLEKCVNEGK